MALFLMGAVAFSGWCWSKSQVLEQEATQYAQSLARVQEMNRQFAATMAKDGLTLSSEEISEVYDKVTFANQLSEKRAFSWTRLLSDLEAALPPRASIKSVRLSFRDSTVKLQGRVMALGDLKALAKSLEDHPAFSRVKVSSHRFEEHEEKGRARKGSGKGGRGRRAGKGRQVVEFDLTVAYGATA